MPLPSFDPDFASNREWADLYRECGLQVVPCRPREKKPALDGWRDLTDGIVADNAFRFMFDAIPPAYGLGILTGSCSGNVFVVDLDLHKPILGPLARAWWAMVTNGADIRTPTQRTGGGGLQILLRAPDDVRMPTNKTNIGVDFRGQGGFAVLAPTLHASGKNYEWLPGLAPWEVEIAEASQDIIEAVFDCAAEHGGTPGGTRTATDTPVTDLSAFGKVQDGRESYMAAMVFAALVTLRAESAIRPSQQEMEARARAEFATYERNVASRLPADSRTNAERLEEEGRGWSAFWFKWNRALRKWDDRIASSAEERKARETREEPKAEAAPSAGLALSSAFPIDPTQIEPRAWIIPGLLIRKHLSVLVAPPGSGKSLLTCQQAIALGAGMNWGGWVARGKNRVLLVNAEDDTPEMQRRLWASADAMGVDHKTLAGQVMLCDAPENIVVAKTDAKTRAVVRTPLVEELIATITANAIDVIVVDPFAETFEGDENNNSEVKWAGIAWREIARRTGASVYLVHHTKKYASGMAGEADASRGGGSLIGTARIVSTLFAMTEDEAASMGVPPDERTHFVRFDDAKANMSLVTGVAKWFRKHSVTLPNATPFTPGDEVGVLLPWKPPSVFEGVSNTQIGHCLDEIERGPADEEGRPTGQLYSPSKAGRTSQRWVGHAAARFLGIDEDKAATVIREWFKTGLLIEVEYDDPKARKSLKGVRVDGSKRPDRRFN